MRSLNTIKKDNELVTTTNSPNLIQYKDERKYNLTRIVKNKVIKNPVFNKYETTNNNYDVKPIKTSENNSGDFFEFIGTLLKLPILVLEFIFSNTNLSVKNYLLHDLKYMFNKKYRNLVKRARDRNKTYGEI